MSTEERSTYRAKLVQALQAAFVALLGNNETTTAGPLTYENLTDAVLAVPNPELDRFREENDRLRAEVNRLKINAERDVCAGCMERERQRDAWIEASRQNGITAEENKAAWHREHERAEAAEAQLAEAQDLASRRLQAIHERDMQIIALQEQLRSRS